MKKIIIISVLALTLTNCTDATRSQFGAYNDEHTIDLYSGGKLVQSWTSTGKVKSTNSSDGYYFRDKECDCNVEVSGDIVITRIIK